MTDADGDEYLAEVLALDPERDMRRVAELRRRRVGSRDPSTAEAAEDDDELRAALDGVADRVLDEDPDALRARLERLNLEHFPGLDQRRARLLAVLDARPEIDRAFDDPQSNRNFVRFVTTLLRANGEQAADLKRRAVTTLRSPSRAKEARRTLQHWKARYPRLYALERVWFEEEAIETTRRLNGMSLGIVVIVLVYIALKSLRFFRD